MSKFWTKYIFIILAVLVNFNSFAQETTKTDTTSHKHRRLTPGKVALLAIVPGAGQIYNKKYLKVPVVYILGGTMLYFTMTNQKKLAISQDSLRHTPTSLKHQNDVAYYHHWRDLSAIGLGMVYVLSIVDAYVDAHLMEFDVSDKLALKIAPDAQYTYAYGIEPKLSITLKFK